MISKDIVETLKQRAKEMLNDDYSRKIGDEELYTIICEWENSLKELETYKKIVEKLAKELIKNANNQYCQYSKEYCLNNMLLCKNCVLDWARKEVEKDAKKI